MEKYTVGDLLLTKSLEDRGTWLWCDENVPALEAVRTMTKANVGALLVMRSSVLDVEHVELETTPDFFDIFVDGCQFKPMPSRLD